MFISRLVRGGLAESTGLLAVNDEILEVNGIDVAGKSLDQVRRSLCVLSESWASIFDRDVKQQIYLCLFR